MEHLRVLRPAAEVYAFYDGRVDGYRFADGPNWVDDGALSLGIASYALVSGDSALVYDTHVSLEHARRIRSVLEADGVRSFTVVLSHWHLDHVAGDLRVRRLRGHRLRADRGAPRCVSQRDRERIVGGAAGDRPTHVADDHVR